MGFTLWPSWLCICLVSSACAKLFVLSLAPPVAALLVSKALHCLFVWATNSSGSYCLTLATSALILSSVTKFQNHTGAQPSHLTQRLSTCSWFSVVCLNIANVCFVLTMRVWMSLSVSSFLLRHTVQLNAQHHMQQVKNRIGVDRCVFLHAFL